MLGIGPANVGKIATGWTYLAKRAGLPGRRGGPSWAWRTPLHVLSAEHTCRAAGTAPHSALHAGRAARGYAGSASRIGDVTDLAARTLARIGIGRD